MAMTVVPNADGSFTVESDGVAVTVGGHRAHLPTPTEESAAPIEADVSVPPFVWPKKPTRNRGGAVAHFHVGFPSGLWNPFDRPAVEVPPPYLVEAAPGARIFTRHTGTNTLVVELHAPPATPLDIGRLQDAMQRLRGDHPGTGVELHIYVAFNDKVPLYDEQLLER